MRHRLTLQLRRAEVGAAGGGADDATSVEDGTGDDEAAVVCAATDAQRRRLIALRADGAIGDAAFQRVEETLGWAQVVRPEPPAHAGP